MSEFVESDIEAFEAEVLKYARLFKNVSSTRTEEIDGIPISKRYFGKVEYEYEFAETFPFPCREDSHTTKAGPVILKGAAKYTRKQKEVIAAVSKAKEITNRKDIREILCPALQTVSLDVMEVAKQITPVLLGAGLAGAIVIPFNPLLFAVTALIIVRTGIATLCKDYPIGDKKKSESILKSAKKAKSRKRHSK